ncbi:hypothetical protein GCM10011371_10950 [Novosphingobium marinum]|uniref:Putative lipoprotein n=1 Tax=Novosphingobium marinum TaxID=1514948 RepID=A0A7Y9XV82_9SPHN|nr:hypothetical protein [Novosphingobium marinum]NYH95204.1 putative lipoprotein [Novosphingobium marinum]GGC25130.1 hypothetical protein GCM10011371_10950 [Novosphingobium marinum]
MKRIALLLAGIAVLAGCSRGEDVASTPSPEELAQAGVQAWLERKYGAHQDVRYALGWADLDGDTIDEAIVYVAGPMLCGTGGCSALVLTREGEHWRAVMETSISRTPVTMLDSRTNGWRDLTVDISGGGGPSGTVRLKYDGDAYPSNPSMVKGGLGAEQGAVLIPIDPEYVQLN